MIYNLNEKFTKIEEVKGILENKCRHSSIELVVTDGLPEKDSGIELQPKEKMPFRVEKKQSLYARCTSLDGIMANLAVVNFNVPASGDSGAGNMVGAIVYGHTVLDGWVTANGALLSREEYPDLFQYAQNNNLLLTEAAWANGMQGMYGVGDGGITFRVPDLRGEFLRCLNSGDGIDSNRNVGSKQGDAIRNIAGSFPSRFNCGFGIDIGDRGVFGAVETTNIVSAFGECRDNDKREIYKATFNASRVVPTAEENRPQNIALIAQIKY